MRYESDLASAAIVEKSRLTTELVRMEDSLNNLNSIIDRLNKRLSHLLVSFPEKDMAEPYDKPEASETVSRILDLHRSINHMGQKLERLLANLEA